jgi:competence ComEA-like helix-hairpin-helix protein
MNKINAMLQTVALSLLLIGGAHATSKTTSANKATVVASASTSSHSKHAGAARQSKKNAQKVNVNTADADAIHQSLINIGPSKAAAIVAYRKEHGAFKTADQLAQVKGIGLKTIEKNRSYIVVGAVAAAASTGRR